MGWIWLYGWRSSAPAKTATSTKAITISAPNTPSGLWRMKCSTPCQSVEPRPASCDGASTAVVSMLLLIIVRRRSYVFHPWVKQAVAHVDHEIGNDHHDRNQQVYALHDRVVAALNGLDQIGAHAGNAEDALHHHRAADQDRNLQPDDREHRVERLLQCVSNHDGARAQPLRLRRAYVVLAQHLQHLGAGQPHDR